MVKKIAIDWDENELRLVAAQCSGRSVKVTDARIVAMDGRTPSEALVRELSELGGAETETLVAIGRGSAELRELQLPPVPDDELPDMVRFQALRSFATAGDSATVDYLVTKRIESGIEVIAAAVGPQSLNAIHESVRDAELSLKRIALRPLSAAALFLIAESSSRQGEVVFIDLLSDGAEIVVARDGKVVFVRTVRMPSSEAARAKALAGELKRSLLACGVSGQLGRVILWGNTSAHEAEVATLETAAGCEVQVVNPFDLVDVSHETSLPDKVGRLAPLVGLLLADEIEPDRLIDFLNPRKPRVQVVSPYRKLLVVGVPIAACVLIAFVVYQRIKTLDQQIAVLRDGNAAMQSDVKLADQSIAKTETMDNFLDGDVNWLHEVRRMALQMPPSEQMIVRGVSASANQRRGGGNLKIEGGAINPSVIDEFERSLRDASHQVNGDGASEQKTEDAYRWAFNEVISVTSDSIRNDRYEGIAKQMMDQPEPESESPSAVQPDDATDSDEDDNGAVSQTTIVEGDASDLPEGSETTGKTEDATGNVNTQPITAGDGEPKIPGPVDDELKDQNSEGGPADAASSEAAGVPGPAASESGDSEAGDSGDGDPEEVDGEPSNEEEQQLKTNESLEVASAAEEVQR